MKARPHLFLLALVGLLIPIAARGESGDPAGASPSEWDSTVEEPFLPKEALVRLEVFTLSREEGRTATRKFPGQADLYAWLEAELEKEKSAVKLERLMVLRVRAGQRAILEELDEYPVPIDPAPVDDSGPVEALAPTASPAPSGPGTDPGSSATPGNPPLPPAASLPPGIVPLPPHSPVASLSYGFRNTGWTTEIELTISDSGKTVDVNLAAEFVRLCGLEGQDPEGDVVRPVFEISRIATMIFTNFGKPVLAGTFSPPVDTGAEGGNTEEVTRLLFITVTNPR